eukprot:TRINITY_DN39918_c0_g1_i1.p1 TRINITY_DN39918_c0_g1~~TRINITY_DN39918_c0_g1_i1.p1  ORF type:complete len:490 (-),score=112.22 TRINITY_DN39918_c0_g1_i1:201-1670(-)
MGKQLIIAILVLGHFSEACAKEDQRTEAESHASLMRAVGKSPGNFAVVGTMQAAVISLRTLLKNMRNVQDNVIFDDNASASKVRLADMMINFMDVKTKFETAVSELVGGMMTVDTHMKTVALGAIAQSSNSARNQLRLDESKQQLKTVKKLMDLDVKSTCDQFSKFLQDWSGSHHFLELQTKVETQDNAVNNAAKELEDLAQKALNAQMEEAMNAAEAVEALQMLRWVNKQEDISEDERKWAQDMQFAKMVLDASSSTVNIAAGPIQMLNVMSDKESAHMPEKEKADTLSADDRKTEIAKYTQILSKAKQQRNVLANKVNDMKDKAAMAEKKLTKLEQERRALDLLLEERIKERGAVSADHATTMLDSISSFFFSSKNLQAVDASVAAFDGFINAWHDHWQMYDGMPPIQKPIYLELLLSKPMGWGSIAPEIWNTVQVFPDLIDFMSRDPLAIPGPDTSKVSTWRETLNEMAAAREALRAETERSKQEL